MSNTSRDSSSVKMQYQKNLLTKILQHDADNNQSRANQHMVYLHSPDKTKTFSMRFSSAKERKVGEGQNDDNL